LKRSFIWFWQKYRQTEFEGLDYEAEMDVTLEEAFHGIPEFTVDNEKN
jgi:hypothetical protein